MEKRGPADNPRVIAGRYRLGQIMARGGMGTVWTGEDVKLRRPVAVKIMTGDLARQDEARLRFQREATTAAQLDSSHVVQIFDYGVDDDEPYIVMELLEGENLSQRLRARNRLTIPECADLLTQVCKGLRAAHAAQLIHRDLKPSNIFIARQDESETYKILDFGVVKALAAMSTEEVTKTGALLGTPQYMSPEQARARRDIDHRSDLWSVAVLVFRALGGINPFGGESVAEVILKLCNEELPRVTPYRPELPLTADHFFAKAFARDPANRYQSVVEFARAFHQLVIPRQQGLPPPGMRQAFGSLLDGGPPTQQLSADQTIPLTPISNPGAPPPRASAPWVGSSRSGPAMQMAPPAGSFPQARAISPPTPHSTTVGGTPVPISPFGVNSRVTVIVGGVAVALLVTIGLTSVLVEPAPSAAPVDSGVTVARETAAAATETAAAATETAAAATETAAAATPSPSSASLPTPEAISSVASAAPSAPASAPLPATAAPAKVTQPKLAAPPAPAPRVPKTKKRKRKKKSNAGDIFK